MTSETTKILMVKLAECAECFCNDFYVLPHLSPPFTSLCIRNCN